MLPLQTARRDFSFALDKEGSSSAARMDAMQITTASSTKVNPADSACLSFLR